MNPADEIATKIEPAELIGGVADPDAFSERAPVNEPQQVDDRLRPVEDLHNLLLRISHHLDFETSERSTIYYRLLAIDGQTKRIETQTKRRVLRGLVRYLIAIGIGVAGVLAWQSYGEATKQFVATKGPELGWSPEAKQTIAGWMQQIGWTKPSADAEVAAVRPPASEAVQAANAAQTSMETSKASVTPAIDPEQVQQITRNLATLQQSVEQLAAGQDQMAREIAKLQTADSEILQKIPAPPPPAPPSQRSASTPGQKPIPLPPARAPAR